MDRKCVDQTVFTVFFEDPFWVGVCQRSSGGMLTVCKVTFGREPKDCEVYDFLLRHLTGLKFSPAVEDAPRPAADNPKRRQRQAAKQVRNAGVGTKSQQALAIQREERKSQRRQASRQQRQAERQRQFDLKRQKQREKHKGH